MSREPAVYVFPCTAVIDSLLIRCPMEDDVDDLETIDGLRLILAYLVQRYEDALLLLPLHRKRKRGDLQ